MTPLSSVEHLIVPPGIVQKHPGPAKLWFIRSQVGCLPDGDPTDTTKTDRRRSVARHLTRPPALGDSRARFPYPNRPYRGPQRPGSRPRRVLRTEVVYNHPSERVRRPKRVLFSVARGRPIPRRNKMNACPAPERTRWPCPNCRGDRLSRGRGAEPSRECRRTGERRQPRRPDVAGDVQPGDQRYWLIHYPI